MLRVEGRKFGVHKGNGHTLLCLRVPRTHKKTFAHRLGRGGLIPLSSHQHLLSTPFAVEVTDWNFRAKNLQLDTLRRQPKRDHFKKFAKAPFRGHLWLCQGALSRQFVALILNSRGAIPMFNFEPQKTLLCWQPWPKLWHASYREITYISFI